MNTLVTCSFRETNQSAILPLAWINVENQKKIQQTNKKKRTGSSLFTSAVIQVVCRAEPSENSLV